MTGNVLIDLAISIIGIAILVGLARLVFPKAGAAAINDAMVRDRLAFDEPDFEIAAFILDAAQGAAIAAGADGDIVLIKKAGEGLATRRTHPGEAACARDGDRLTVTISDHTFRGFSLKTASDAEAQQWAVRITGEAAID